jgi:hypothetical protein
MPSWSIHEVAVLAKASADVTVGTVVSRRIIMAAGVSRPHGAVHGLAQDVRSIKSPRDRARWGRGTSA